MIAQIIQLEEARASQAIPAQPHDEITSWHF